jgi:hypothetical protein
MQQQWSVEKNIRVGGINRERPVSPEMITSGRNSGGVGGILPKQKKMQCGKRSRESGNQLDPARKLMMVAVSPQCGTHATEDTKVGTLTGGSRDSSREEMGRGDRSGWKNIVIVFLLFGGNGEKEIRLGHREGWSAVALCPALVGTGVLVWRHNFPLRNKKGHLTVTLEKCQEKNGYMSCPFKDGRLGNDTGHTFGVNTI